MNDPVEKQAVLVVDDAPTNIQILMETLKDDYRIVAAINGERALQLAISDPPPDIILLDVMMPEMDGYEFMRAHRREAETPIILLTAKVEDDDKVIGLELGADDYVTKPFRPRELVARVRAVLRRTGQNRPEATVLRASDIALDRERHTVEIGDRYVDLTPSEFDLLAALMSVPGRAYSRLELLDRIQGVAFEGYERTIDVHIKNLRSKVEPEPKEPHYIQTVYGVGYRFVRE